MQPISSFNSNLGTAILLCGGAGSGKTSLGMRLFPKTYVNVTDLNFESGKRYLEKLNLLGNVVGFDTPAFADDGKVIVPNQRYDRMFAQLSAAAKDPNIEAIFLDSASFIEDVIKSKICGAVSEATIKLEGYPQWGSLLITWKSLVMQLRQTGKKIIMAAHEEKELDKLDGIFRYGISVDGQIKAKFPAFFSDVWRCSVVENLGKHSWMVQTLSNQRQEHLKNTYGLPALLTADEVVKTLGQKP